MPATVADDLFDSNDKFYFEVAKDYILYIFEHICRIIFWSYTYIHICIYIYYTVCTKLIEII